MVLPHVCLVVRVVLLIYFQTGQSVSIAWLLLALFLAKWLVEKVLAAKIARTIN